MLHVLGQQDAALGLDRGGDDQRIVERQIAGPRDLHRLPMDLPCQRPCGPCEFFHDLEGRVDLAPVPAQLAPRDAGELVDDLDACDTTGCEHFLGPRASPIALGKRVDQDVGIEEALTGHWPLPARS
jgi:hypothetical protein